MTKLLLKPTDGVITQGYGENPANYAEFGLAGHNGVDFAGPYLTPVFFRIAGIEDDGTAANGIGTVVKVERGHRTLGNYCVIHVQDTRVFPNGYFLMYAHLNKDLKVVQGIGIANHMLIGFQDTTGRSTGVHLHWGLYRCTVPFEWRAGFNWIGSIDYYSQDSMHGSSDPMQYMVDGGAGATPATSPVVAETPPVSPSVQHPRSVKQTTVAATKAVGKGALYHYLSMGKKWIAMLPIILTLLGFNPEVVQTAQMVVQKAPEIIALIETLEADGTMPLALPTPDPVATMPQPVITSEQAQQPALCNRWYTLEPGVYLRSSPNGNVENKLEYAERQTKTAFVCVTGDTIYGTDGEYWTPVEIESTGETGWMAYRYLGKYGE